MVPSFEELIQEVRTRSGKGSALETLEIAVQLSAQLSDLADDVVNEFVTEARVAGHSWTEIGNRLGVTKQAAQQRFVAKDRISKRVLTAFFKKGEKGPMFERFNSAAREVMVRGQDEARALGHNYLGTEHQLLGILAAGDKTAELLNGQGVSLDRVRDEVSELIGKGTGPPATGPPPFTPRAKKVIELAFREALQLGHNHVSSEHILLALIREGEGVAAQVLNKLDVSGEEIRSRIRELPADGESAL
jgi:hypothetical protein